MMEHENDFIKETDGNPDEKQDSQNNDGKADDTQKAQSELYDWAQALVTALVFVVLMFALFVRVIGVDGESMMPTLHNGDKVLITNLFYTPEYGDIVVLTKRSFMDQPIVKRVIATEGQTVQIDYNTGQLWIDGLEIFEPYIREPMKPSGDLDFSQPVTIPDGCVFVMGDNRNHSSDSRRSVIGMIDERYILGRVVVRLYPFDRIGKP